ncbi:DUF3139 domain-containing protein [Aneurinibacillus tyrosinisolvens]|uniref:DUF3139 domain-containing protein n=1 Tax=Aneurinibacillus tyrosinisolvens TaxID=1443435 RepID=UPI00063EE2BD|nr:DUF3139 domain-containing protein [Aneurinibacillus tyrosinisolvens]
MSPNQIIGLWLNIFFILLILFMALMSKGKYRKILIASSVLLAIWVWGLSPIWTEYRVSAIQKDVNEYLKSRYPRESWKLERADKTSPSANPYRQDVTFANEPRREYSYTANLFGKVRQVGNSAPEDEISMQGKHFEMYKQ